MKTKNLLMMATAVLLSVACSNNDELTSSPTSLKNQDGEVELTFTIAGKGGDATRSVNESGVTAWQANEEIWVNYTDNEGIEQNTKATVQSVDSNGKATVNATLNNPKNGCEVTFGYPYSLYAGQTELYNSQDGTVAALSSKFDKAEGTATLTVIDNKAWIPGSVTMENKVCIWKLTLNNGSSPITNSVNKLIISDGTNVYNVKPSNAENLYVALNPASGATITVKAWTSDNKIYSTNYPGMNLDAGKIYTNTLALSDITNTYQLTLDDVTLDDIGKVVCSDRSVYATKSAAVSANKTVVGMIAHVQGPNNNAQVDASSTSYRGLVISLAEESARPCTQNGKERLQYEACMDETKVSDTPWGRFKNLGISGINQTQLYKQGKTGHTHGYTSIIIAYSNSYPHPSNTSEWFIPTSAQWCMMFYDLANKAGQNVLPNEEIKFSFQKEVDNEKFLASSMNSVFNDAGITALSEDARYYCTHEQRPIYYSNYNSNYGSYTYYYKDTGYFYIRLVFAF